MKKFSWHDALAWIAARRSSAKRAKYAMAPILQLNRRAYELASQCWPLLVVAGEAVRLEECAIAMARVEADFIYIIRAPSEQLAKFDSDTLESNSPMVGDWIMLSAVAVARVEFEFELAVIATDQGPRLHIAPTWIPVALKKATPRPQNAPCK